jgi:hypothetical protein
MKLEIISQAYLLFSITKRLSQNGLNLKNC